MSKSDVCRSLHNKEDAQEIENISHEDNACSADPGKEPQKFRLDGLAQHHHGGQGQGGDRHHERQHHTQLSTLGQQSLRNGDGAENVSTICRYNCL